jgi:hypothetical protein
MAALFLGNIKTAGDHDAFAVSLTAGQPYIFEASGAGPKPLGNPTLGLRDAAGALVTVDDNGGPGLDSRIEFTPPVGGGGVYFLEARGVGGATGTYHVTSRVDDAADDIQTKDSIPVGGQRLGDINNILDRDFFRVQLVGGTPYTFSVVGNTLINPTLALRDAAGALLTTAAGASPTINFVAPNSGPFYLVVGGVGANTGSYTLHA